MTKRHMKKYAVSLITRAMKIKATMRYYFKPVRMAIIKKSTSNKCREKKHSYTVGRNIKCYSHYGEQYGGSLKTNKQTKTKNRNTIWSSNSTPGHVFKEKHGLKGCTLLFIAALFTVVKTCKESKKKCLLTDEWIKMIWYRCIIEYYSAIKKNETMPFTATWRGLEIIILSGVSQIEKDKYHDIAYIQDILNDTNALIYKTKTDPLTWIMNLWLAG